MSFSKDFGFPARLEVSKVAVFMVPFRPERAETHTLFPRRIYPIWSKLLHFN